jgi:hypothetical protein
MKIELNNIFRDKISSYYNSIPKHLNTIIDEGFTKTAEVITAKKIASPSIDDINFLHKVNDDLTGVECFLNKLHIENANDSSSHDNHMSSIITGVIFINLICIRILEQFPGEKFRFILSEEEGDHPSVVFRFHKIRDNEHWLPSNLETSKNGIFYLDTP